MTMPEPGAQVPPDSSAATWETGTMSMSDPEAKLPDPPAATTFTWDDVQRLIQETADETRRVMQEEHERDMNSLRAQVANAVPTGQVPEHGAGPGTTVRETWSQAEQEAARAAAEAARAAA